MRVAVIAPPYPLEEAPAPPLGVSYVAAAFEAAGAEVKIIDYIVSRYSPEKFAEELDLFKPDVVGGTSVTMNFPHAAEIIKTAKELRPSAVTMMGGPHVTFDAENTLKRYPEIDLIMLGEGEETIREFVPRVRDPEAWAEVKGLAFRREGKMVRTEPRELVQDLDGLPLPARHLLECSRYLALGFPVSIITGRGCPYPCIFCQGRRMVGSRVRYRDPVKIVDEIEEILSYGFNRINVADDLFLSNKQRAQAVCREILGRGIEVPWSAFARVNTVDQETLRLMREAGCDSVSFGIESGNPEMLERVKKKITLDQARSAVRMCNDAGILAHASFMIGLPGETRETMKDSEDFARSLDIIYGYHFLAPFPGTTVREKIDEYDLEILTDDWALYDANRAIVRTSSLSAEDIEEFFQDYDVKNKNYWAKIERQYREGTVSPEEGFRVLGKHRMDLSFLILSEDIIEEHGAFPLSALDSGTRTAEDLLLEKVEQVTGRERDLIDQTVGDFIRKGYIKCRKTDRDVRWYWTHNHREEFGPVSLTRKKLSA